MAMALMHPQHGYYMKGSPIGAEGAFTTAPEISQMFGELLGAWLHQQWQSLGCPSPVDILELGPGRGTFMADVLRVTGLDPAFTRAANVRLVEPSPSLRAMQQDRLRPFAVPVTWHSSLASVPLEGPVLIFANEVFDALPVRHLKRGPKGWHERYIDVEEGRLVWRFAADVTPDVLIPAALRQSADGAIVEISPARAGLMAEICGHLQTRDGAALIIDYGYAQSQLGETLQALRRHQPVDPL
ncbi:MAG TPA: methyltransferase, partial [Alphaproteobacteria bacterium]|nr:methyltransferase [Alphaproteobacteria bacterium]